MIKRLYRFIIRLFKSKNKAPDLDNELWGGKKETDYSMRGLIENHIRGLIEEHIKDDPKF